MRISDWSSDVCSSDLAPCLEGVIAQARLVAGRHMLDPDDHVGVDVRLEQGGGDAGQAVEGPHGQVRPTSTIAPAIAAAAATAGLARWVRAPGPWRPTKIGRAHV